MNNKKLEKMRLGRRATYLRRCVVALELAEKYETGVTIRSRVFAKYIQPVMLCSYQTFNNMLNEPNPRKQLDEIERQLKLL